MTDAIVTFSADTEIKGNTLYGYAHVFGQVANVGTHYEQFAKGAFDEALKTADVRAFLQHDQSKLLGRQSSGTLRVSTDSKGLAYEIDLPNTTYANDLRVLYDRGDIREMSFGFIPGKYGWVGSQDNLKIRQHTQVRALVDVSPVAIPAFGGTSISLRSETKEESLRSQLARARARILL